MASEFTQMAVENMRHVNDFHWSFITLLIITAYVYTEEAQRKTGVGSSAVWPSGGWIGLTR